MTARVSMLLKSHASLTCFRACFLPGRAKDLSALRYLVLQVQCLISLSDFNHISSIVNRFSKNKRQGKVKVQPRTGYEGPKGSRGIAVLFL